MLLALFERIHLSMIKVVVIIGLSGFTTGCVGTVVGAVVDTAVEVVKVPFKVGGAVIDAVTPDNDFVPDNTDEPSGKDDEDNAVHMEQDIL